ncbi:hypothetical protein [Lysinibacillus cavernae]|uniref:hypothetical protein n=1 Tax=Lysinibacillus cavernae TaxID=2666135 RepID=UPI0012D9EB23|nr:hypothetical protein [Lysinibacillus cavernae]
MFIKRIFTLWFLLSFLVCGAFVFFANAPIQYAEKSNVPMSRPSNNELLSYIQQYQFLISDISNALRKESYHSLVDYGVLPNGKIELLVSLPDKVDNMTKQNIEETMLAVIKEHDLHQISFQLTLKSLYEPSDTLSTRLSYNDVMANLFEAMIEQNYDTFSIDHSITSENIHILINLTEEKNEALQKQVQQLAEDTIREHHFDLQRFTIEVQRNIKNTN